MASFGDRLKKYRHEKGMTQQELADLLGVSNKTVSRWESEGGYPDVSMLVPLARALGVTVDDLLDGERPIRTLTKADWQNLLSFGFALGGGVLFFLFDLFMPMVVCYLAYLGCMAYGVYLQKYYSYQSRWFFLSNAIMNLSVNLSIVGLIPAALAAANVSINIYNQHELGVQLMWWMVTHIPLLMVLMGLAAVLLTALTQYLVLRWSKGTLSRKGEIGYRIGVGRPKPTRKLVLPLIPLAHIAFWLCYSGEEGNAWNAEWLFRYQKPMFAALVAVSLLLVLLLFRKREWRVWRISGLLFSGICACSWWMANRNMMYWTVKGTIFTYREMTSYRENYLRFSACRPEQLIFLSVLAVIWLLLCFIRVERKPTEE